MDPVNAYYSLDILGGDAVPSVGSVTSVPSVEALERFQQSMQGTGLALDPATNESSLQLGGVNATGTMGDKILEGLQGLKSGLDSTLNSVQNSVSGSEVLNTREMMSLHFELIKFSLQTDLMSKTVSKSTQNLDTLLKSQ